MDWITDQIAIGNHIDAWELPEPVDAILCLKEGCCDMRDDVDAVCIPLVDGPGNDPRAVSEAVSYLSEVVNEGRRILVHCHAGRSRSVVIVARHLMANQLMTPERALELIHAKREIYLSPGIDQLLSLHR
jgi:protein-tyrosine phosphatase